MAKPPENSKEFYQQFGELRGDVNAMKDDITEIKKCIDKKVVMKEEFEPVKRAFYILLTILSSLPPLEGCVNIGRRVCS